ncbi:Glucose dehydrogenase [FAD, quinone], partial [Orchesella cincta]
RSRLRGSVLANRLSSNPDYSVLLLENGGNPNPIQNVPFYFQSLLHIPEIDYGYYTVPQKHACLAMKEQRSYWPRGMGLGGTSNLNCMFWQRSSPHDYDRWAKLSGSDDGEKWHSQKGNGIYVSTVGHDNLVDEFLEAGREMGYPTKDVNGNQEPSFSRLDVSIKEGRRFGAYPGFLEPVLDRTNLFIYRYAHVNKIHLEKKTNRAYGITYKRHGVERFVRARREIIISAGAIDSPKLLMLSGIGPKKHLENRMPNQSPSWEKPDGSHHDNIRSFYCGHSWKNECAWERHNLNTVVDYFSNRRGIMASAIAANAVAYIQFILKRDWKFEE